MQRFEDRALRFAVAVPDDWHFLPPAWSPAELFKRGASQESLIQLANKPFVCAMGHHDSERHAYPTLQATVRPFGIPDNAQAREILEAQCAALAETHADFRCEWSTSEGIVAGYRANLMRATFAIETQPDGVHVTVRALARSYLVFTPGRAFTIALSSSADARFYDEADFDAIIASLQIG